MGAKVIIFDKILNSTFLKGLRHSAVWASHLKSHSPALFCPQHVSVHGSPEEVQVHRIDFSPGQVLDISTLKCHFSILHPDKCGFLALSLASPASLSGFLFGSHRGWWYGTTSICLITPGRSCHGTHGKRIEPMPFLGLLPLRCGWDPSLTWEAILASD